MPFQEHSDLRIGHVTEVSGSTIRVELDRNISELTRVINGRVCAIGQLASVVKIHFGRRMLFAYVRLLRMRSEIAAEDGKTTIVAGDDSRVLEADLFAEGIWASGSNNLVFSRGVETYPLPLQGVFLTTPTELELIFGAAEAAADVDNVSPMVKIGDYIGGGNVPCRANIDKLFGQHSAILGSTGSGKSGTVAAVLRSVLEHTDTAGEALKPRVVLIDPHGEYRAAFPNEAVVLNAYEAAARENEEAASLRLPYWLMSGDELRSLIIGKTEAEATSQNNIIYKALKFARMVEAGIVNKLPPDPLGDQEAELAAGKTLDDLTSFDRDRPYRFCLDEFVKHIDKVQGRKPGKADSLSASERKSIDSILDKLSVLRSDPRIKFLMRNDADDTLNRSISQFVGETPAGRNLRIVDISGIPNEVAGTLTALTCRLLFNYKIWQTGAERRKDPVLLVCEEAHRYVPDRGEAQYREAQDAIRRIAKEGRKYGLGLLLVSQRPSDVESTVLSQCNSWIILRLTNATDQDHVRRFLPDSLAGITKILSSLARREAIFVGEAAALPARIRMRHLEKEHLPSSDDISFVAGWNNPPVTPGEIGTVLQRWLK